jgi:hypothetical protein
MAANHKRSTSERQRLFMECVREQLAGKRYSGVTSQERAAAARKAFAEAARVCHLRAREAPADEEVKKT